MPTGLRQAIQGALHRRRVRFVGRARQTLGWANEEVRLLQLMQKDNATGPVSYQAGKFWREINSDFTTLMHAGALARLRDEYFNRRFAGPEPESRQVYQALLKLYWDQLKPRDTLGFLDKFQDSDAAGVLDIDVVYGRRVSLDFLQSVDEALLIRQYFAAYRAGATPKVIVELGAGYGRLAYVCRQMFPDCIYIILDLPEALMCAHSFLQRALPKDLVPYEKGRSFGVLDRRTLEQGRIWLLGAQQIKTLAPDVADVFANIYSLAEMAPEAIVNYLAQIDRVTSGIFLTKQRRVEENVVDNARIDDLSYPIPVNWRKMHYGVATLYESFFQAVYATRTF